MSEETLVWLELGPAALPVLLDEFWHDDPLSLPLRRHIESTPGCVRAYLPAGVSLDRALQIRAGGFLPEGPRHHSQGWTLVAVDSLIDARNDQFAQLLQDNPALVCLIPDFNPRPGDPRPVQGPGAFWVAGRCYHWVDATMGRDVLIASFDEAELSWNGFALLAEVPSDRSKAELQTAEGLQLLARSAVQVSFRAYDGESFWIWSPTEP